MELCNTKTLSYGWTDGQKDVWSYAIYTKTLGYGWTDSQKDVWSYVMQRLKATDGRTVRRTYGVMQYKDIRLRMEGQTEGHMELCNTKTLGYGWTDSQKDVWSYAIQRH